MPPIKPAFNASNVSRTLTTKDTELSSKKLMEVVVTAVTLKPGKSKGFAPSTLEKQLTSKSIQRKRKTLSPK